jgi:hypothetical protein
MTRATDDLLNDIPGWFHGYDVALFRWFLSEQVNAGTTGDLAELGGYLGKSAVVIGDYVQPGETFTVIDLFDTGATDSANATENSSAYPDLTRQAFERNYLRVHPTPPTVIQGYSETITEHARLGRHRFVHIDASHLYEHVRGDIRAAEKLLSREGVVVLDDLTSAHSPGVAAAVWQEIVAGDLHAIVTSEHKMYATWGDAGRWQEALMAWMASSPMPWEEQTIAGSRVLRIGYTPGPVQRPNRTREVVKSLVPPAAVTAARRLRQRH